MRWVKIILALLILGVGGAAAFPYLQDLQTYWKARNRPEYREVLISRAQMTQMVNSTGTVQPVRRVQVGSFVSGPIEKLHVNYNSVVKKGDLMAEIDQRIFNAAVSRDKANCASAESEVSRVKSQLQQAINDEKRAENLRKTKKDYLSESEMDRLKFHRLALDAQLAVANAGVAQAKSQLQNSEANLSYTKIKAPVDGIVIDRKVDEGQTIVAQFQTPELFIVAPEIEQHVQVFASVDEADIGLIRKAEREKRPVTFTVDAYPEDTFSGTIFQVRINPTVTQNVVTYIVVVEATNPDMKLLPGMTANLTFQIDIHDKVLRVPNLALRFFPRADQVRPEDRSLIEGNDEDAEAAPRVTTEERLAAAPGTHVKQDRHVRYLWVTDGDFLRAVKVVTGISDKEFTEIVSGVQEGDRVVTGLRTQ